MPACRTLLGFDFGLRRIGVAVGQELTGTATDLETLPAREGQPDWERVGRLIEQWQPDALVVGVPYHMDGSEHPLTHAARRFARRLHGRFGLPVFELDERLSSWEAEAVVREQRACGRRGRSRKGDLDRLAARIILENWLQQEAQPP
ncbi:MAG TPA: Holliday junction resolvase RuvX [Thiotrichales bacterium]|nr:Holliday junction resolvase RuvX [Thiotrichales bacterium]